MKVYTFQDIVGNERIKKNFQNSLEANKLSHAYIINGVVGSGRKLMANVFAKTVECERGGITPCCQCVSCHCFDSGNNPDVIYVKPTKTKSLGVDDVREQIVSLVDIKPYKYRYKVFIIENANQMTIAAQNALLKTIEEPPSYALFFLISDNLGDFLPTILSRCICLKIRSLTETEINNYIVNNLNVESGLARVYSAFAQGTIGKAEKIVLSEEFSQQREKILTILKDLPKKDLIEVMNLAKEFEEYKDDIETALDICYMWYRDVLFAGILNKDYIVQADKVPFIIDELNKHDESSIFKILDIINETKNRLKQNSNFQLSLEVMFMKIKELQ